MKIDRKLQFFLEKMLKSATIFIGLIVCEKIIGEKGKKINNGGSIMSKTIGRKVCGLVIICGVIMALMCVANIAAFNLVGDYVDKLEKSVDEYGEACKSGDVDAQTSAYEDIDYVFEKTDTKVEGTVIFNYILVVATVVVIIAIMIVVHKTVAGPARLASQELGEIMTEIENGQGDLTKRLTVKTKDEVGQLVVGFNSFIETLQKIMAKLKVDTENLLRSADNVNNQVNGSNENSVNISAAMQELSASMEEVSATVEQIATGSITVLDSVKGVNEKAGEGAGIVETIKNKSGDMYKETIDSKEKASKVINEIKEDLRSSVNESKSVEKIGELTADILGIAGQTNLLSLNASIEAARAGEVGRGFAVVAHEISVLADSSRDTANNIQEISNVVTLAVEKLAKSAERMIDFIDEQVIGDYDGFVKIVEQYRADADSMNDILQGFAKDAAEIEETMQNMTQGINDIAITVDESARGVADVAENSVDLVNAMSLIKDESESNEDIAKSLNEEVSRFKQV